MKGKNMIEQVAGRGPEVPYYGNRSAKAQRKLDRLSINITNREILLDIRDNPVVVLKAMGIMAAAGFLTMGVKPVQAQGFDGGGRSALDNGTGIGAGGGHFIGGGASARVMDQAGSGVELDVNRMDAWRMDGWGGRRANEVTRTLLEEKGHRAVIFGLGSDVLALEMPLYDESGGVVDAGGFLTLTNNGQGEGGFDWEEAPEVGLVGNVFQYKDGDGNLMLLCDTESDQMIFFPADERGKSEPTGVVVDNPVSLGIKVQGKNTELPKRFVVGQDVGTAIENGARLIYGSVEQNWLLVQGKGDDATVIGTENPDGVIRLMPQDLPMGAHYSEDGTKIMDADGKDLYILEKDNQGETNWVEAKPPLGETQPWMEEYVEAYSQRGATLEAYVIEDYQYIYRQTASDYDALKITINVPTEEMVRKFTTTYNNQHGYDVIIPIEDDSMWAIGLFGGETILLREQGPNGEGGRTETWFSLLTVYNGQVVKLWASFSAGIDYETWGLDCPELKTELGEFLSVSEMETVLRGGDPIQMILSPTSEFDYTTFTQEDLDKTLFMMSGGFFHLTVDLDQ